MLFNLKKVINWKSITENKRKQIARDNGRENDARIDYEYQIGDRVLRKKKGILRKFAKKKSDPHQVIAIHSNGTVTIPQR